VGVVERLGSHFGLHPLALEDIVNTNQRPKVEDFETYVYFVVRMLSVRSDEDGIQVDNEQISIIVGHNFVLTFQERPGDVFETVRQRIRENRGKIRKSGADYLAYSLIDVVVDNYFVVLEEFGEEVEEVEGALMEHPTQELLQDIQRMKRFMIDVRRAIWPLRDVVNAVLRGDVKLFRKPTLVFLRDVYDHCVRVVDITETYREMVASMMEIYLSQMSHRMNEVIKVLTIIATIFIPLTFIAGVYGMNFDNMPELHWDMGYGFVWGVMIALGATLLFFFRRKKWL
jgi:magnesium transporter